MTALRPAAGSCRPALPPVVALAAVLVAAVAAVLVAPRSGEAQIRASEPASVAQTIDGTKITIEYFRPKARGRSPLFGPDGVVWEKIWTPGANWATTIEFEKPIRIEGHEVPAGKHGLWMVMSEEGLLPEEFLVYPEPKRFHTNPPNPDSSILRLPVERGEAPYAEMLTWGFEDVRTDGATLALRWGTLRIPFEIAVEPTMRRIATDEEAAPVVGSWTVRWTGEEGSTPPFSMVVERAPDGSVHADIEGFPGDGEEAEWLNGLDLMLLPVGERIFAIGEAWDGELTEVWPGAMVEFEVTDGPSTTLEFRDDEDHRWGEGERSG